MRIGHKAGIPEPQWYEGYTQLYETLAERWSHDFFWYVGIITIGWTVVRIFVLDVMHRPLGIELIAAIIALTLLTLAFGFAWLVLTLTLSASANPVREIPTFAVALMTVLRQPYDHPQTGLSHKHLEHLKRIAVAERDAAEWRGAFVSFVILGTISAVFWGWSFYERNLIPTENGSPASLQPGSNILGAPALPAWFDTVMIAFIALVFLWMVVVLLNYFRRFLSGEAANRVIIKACEEAMAFLELRELADRKRFTFLEKKAIAAHFGCKIIPGADATKANKLWIKGQEPDGQIWFLVPTAKNSIILRVIFLFRQLLLWIKMNTARILGSRRPNQRG